MQHSQAPLFTFVFIRAHSDSRPAVRLIALLPPSNLTPTSIEKDALACPQVAFFHSPSMPALDAFKSTIPPSNRHAKLWIEVIRVLPFRFRSPFRTDHLFFSYYARAEFFIVIERSCSNHAAIHSR
jgi:hypothetical protein